MRHIDLFSGIGGFALAVDTVWPNSEHIFCDNDPFCQQILKKHWPNSKIYGDIRTLRNTESNTIKEVRKIQSGEGTNPRRGDRDSILTGGFPCQPFSQAGRRQGTADDRYLWPEMFRVIREFKPTWVVAENVRGLVTWSEGLVLEQVCLDLESEGYEVQPLIIPAVAVNAPHRRDRIWFIAHRNSERGGTQRHGYNQDGQESHKGRQEQPQYRSNGQSGNATDTTSTRLERHKSESEAEGRSNECGGTWGDQRWDWSTNWVEVATELCRVDDGLPAELDGFKLSKAGHRAARLKALGNSIVPQVAIQIMQAIKLTQ